jgi:cytochrome P450
MFDKDLNTMGSSESDGRTLLTREETVLKEYAMRQMLNPLRFLMFWDKDVKEAKEAAVGMMRFEEELLSSYRSKKSPAEIEKDPSILGHLVRSPYESDVERCADMTLFVGAGSDTIAYTLAWTFLEISRNPEVCQKLKDEINAIAPGDGAITAQQVSMMTYLDCVLKESMRLWPVLSQGVPRELSKDIKYNDYVIPKGSVVIFPFIAIFRNGIEVTGLKLVLDYILMLHSQCSVRSKMARLLSLH